ncbi:YkoP family protein [Ornithinibacillus scapharcae]|uniref:YkoP family protein n=1 Tax=Ornithinibacillus scapharcae TaxID=1147159 RepID=UPI000225B129|nr:hypothetical protein [Ornithinibacillus scapharcae]
MKSYLLGVWNVFDPIYYSLTRLNYVCDLEAEKTLFRVRLTRYKGRTTTLSDGTIIYKNDLLIKIHLHNVKIMNELYSVSNDTKRAVYIYHMVKKSMPMLAEYVRTHKRFSEIKGIVGITSLYKGTKRLGFDNVPIHNSIYKAYKRLTFMPINYLASSSRHENPVYLFMSRNELVNRYRMDD